MPLKKAEAYVLRTYKFREHGLVVVLENPLRIRLIIDQRVRPYFHVVGTGKSDQFIAIIPVVNIFLWMDSVKKERVEGNDRTVLDSGIRGDLQEIRPDHGADREIIGILFRQGRDNALNRWVVYRLA